MTLKAPRSKLPGTGTTIFTVMSQLAEQHGAVNLSQGFPDFSAPEDIKHRAMEAIDRDVNQYAITWGAKDFRDAIAHKTKSYLGIEIDPEQEITVTCGSTEGMIAAMMATVDPVARFALRVEPRHLTQLPPPLKLLQEEHDLGFGVYAVGAAGGEGACEQ